MSGKIVYRSQYMKKLIDFCDTDFIKVVTGIRRSGKSTLLKMMIEHLLQSGINKSQIIEMNFESFRFSGFTSEDFYEYVDSHRVDGKMYLFFDEVQIIEEWEKAVNAFRIDFDCDIYLTGSNAHLLSSQLSTYLSGRYVEIKVYPLSFKEFFDFYDMKIEKKKTNMGEFWIAKDNEGNSYDVDQIFMQYMRFGGMPSIKDVGFDMDKISAVLDGIYSAVVVRDILERGKAQDAKATSDPILLRKLVMFLADNIGSSISANNVSNTLLNEGLVSKKTKPASYTIQSYINALIEAYVFYEIKRFDIRGKQFLKTNGKYYIVDTGLRNYLLGFRDGDRGHLLENIIYFELLRRGYSVAIGKIGNKEIDFIVTKTKEKKYIQVTESIKEKETRERELGVLMQINDNYEKLLITSDKDMFDEENGIRIISVIDFLLSES